MRDPYSVLGVRRDARDDEIKAAWRARAKSVHPDHNGSDPLAATRFAEIGAAYELLKDPEKRRRYDARRKQADAAGEQTFMQKRAAEKEAAARAKAARAEAERVMEELSRANAQRAANAKGETADAGAGAPETPEDLINRIFGGAQAAAEEQTRATPGEAPKPQATTMPGDGATAQTADTGGAQGGPAPSGGQTADAEGPDTGREPPSPLSVQAVEFISGWFRRLRGLEPAPEKAPDIHSEAIVTLADLIRGGKGQVALADGRELRFLLLPGMGNGHVLKFEGHGHRIPGMQRGDLAVTLKIAPDARFRAEGFDIHTLLPVSLENAVLGCECTIETPEGPLDVTVPAWSDSTRVIRIAGRGLRETPDHRGDLVVEIRLVLWEKPDDKVTDLMRHMREGLYI